MSTILRDLKSYFNSKFDIYLNDEEFNILKPRELIRNEADEHQLILLGEYLLFIAAQEEYYYKILEDIPTKDENGENNIYKTTLVKILEIRFSNKEDGEEEDLLSNNDNNNSNENEKEDNENELAHIARINHLEKENQTLSSDILLLRERNIELIRENQLLDDLYKDTELRYQEALSSLDSLEKYRNKEFSNNQDNHMDSTSYLIQISELNGKLKQNENTIKKIKEEKEHLIGETKENLYVMSKELNRLKEIEQKYLHFNSKLEKENLNINDIVKIKHKNSTYETTIKKLEDKIKSLLKIDESDKGKLFKKIEELNFMLSQEKQLVEETRSDKESIMSKYIDLQKESENDKKKIEEMDKIMKNLQNTQEDFSNTIDNQIEATLSSINKSSTQDEETARLKSTILNFEIKIKRLENEIKQKKDCEYQLEDIEQMKFKIEHFEKEAIEKNRLHEEQLELISSFIYSLGIDLLTLDQNASSQKKKIRSTLTIDSIS